MINIMKIQKWIFETLNRISKDYKKRKINCFIKKTK